MQFSDTIPELSTLAKDVIPVHLIVSTRWCAWRTMIAMRGGMNDGLWNRSRGRIVTVVVLVQVNSLDSTIDLSLWPHSLNLGLLRRDWCTSHVIDRDCSLWYPRRESSWCSAIILDNLKSLRLKHVSHNLTPRFFFYLPLLITTITPLLEYCNNMSGQDAQGGTHILVFFHYVRASWQRDRSLEGGCDKGSHALQLNHESRWIAERAECTGPE